ncbi:hypothetical protein GCM10009552_19690 [Rothia nasimurium]
MTFFSWGGLTDPVGSVKASIIAQSAARMRPPCGLGAATMRGPWRKPREIRRLKDEGGDAWAQTHLMARSVR